MFDGDFWQLATGGNFRCSGDNWKKHLQKPPEGNLENSTPKWLVNSISSQEYSSELASNYLSLSIHLNR
jgi:hypothetical protein